MRPITLKNATERRLSRWKCFTRFSSGIKGAPLPVRFVCSSQQILAWRRIRSISGSGSSSKRKVSRGWAKFRLHRSLISRTSKSSKSLSTRVSSSTAIKSVSRDRQAVAGKRLKRKICHTSRITVWPKIRRKNTKFLQNRLTLTLKRRPRNLSESQTSYNQPLALSMITVLLHNICPVV